MDADGMALMFWVAVGGLVLLVLAGGLEWLFSRPDRRWIKQLRELEHARVAWQARVIRDQCFWREGNQ